MSFLFPNARLLIFTKAPKIGYVKTRLVPPLSYQEAVDFHSRMTIHTIKIATQSSLCPVVIYSVGDATHPFFQQCVNTYNIQLKTQQGNDLGQRVINAFDESLKEVDHTIIIGTDCLIITADYLKRAFYALKKDNDVVLGPAEDGGYVLIGLNKIYKQLFENMPWSTPSVLQKTREIIKASHLKHVELETLWDVDRPEDLERMYYETRFTKEEFIN